MRHTGQDGHRRREPNEDRQGCSAKPAHYYTFCNPRSFGSARQGFLASGKE
jgi:hypothetical protein